MSALRLTSRLWSGNDGRLSSPHFHPDRPEVHRSIQPRDRRRLVLASLSLGLALAPASALGARGNDCSKDSKAACTDRERVESLVYHAGRACGKAKWELCTDLATRALAIDPTSKPASTMLKITARRGFTPHPVRYSPGFLNGLFQVSLSTWYGGLGTQHRQILGELYVGKRFLRPGSRAIVQFDAGLVMGSLTPYDSRPMAIVGPGSDPQAPETPVGFLPSRFGAGAGGKLTFGFAIKTSKVSAIEFVVVPGLRVVGVFAPRSAVLFGDIGVGPAFQFGRLRLEALGQVSGGTWTLGEGGSPAIWGFSIRGSIGVGRGEPAEAKR